MPMFYVEEQLQISRSTLVDWHNFNCDLCCQWVDNHFTPIGGLDENFKEKIIEIDKSCFYRRKHHVSHMGPHQWVFGGVKRGSWKCPLLLGSFLVQVPN